MHAIYIRIEVGYFKFENMLTSYKVLEISSLPFFWNTHQEYSLFQGQNHISIFSWLKARGKYKNTPLLNGFVLLCTMALRGLKITWVCIAILFISCSLIL